VLAGLYYCVLGIPRQNAPPAARPQKSTDMSKPA
jgi:hypothetical protein